MSFGSLVEGATNLGKSVKKYASSVYDNSVSSVFGSSDKKGNYGSKRTYEKRNERINDMLSYLDSTVNSGVLTTEQKKSQLDRFENDLKRGGEVEKTLYKRYEDNFPTVHDNVRKNPYDFFGLVSKKDYEKVQEKSKEATRLEERKKRGKADKDEFVVYDAQALLSARIDMKRLENKLKESKKDLGIYEEPGWKFWKRGKKSEYVLDDEDSGPYSKKDEVDTDYDIDKGIEVDEPTERPGVSEVVEEDIVSPDVEIIQQEIEEAVVNSVVDEVEDQLEPTNIPEVSEILVSPEEKTENDNADTHEFTYMINVLEKREEEINSIRQSILEKSQIAILDGEQIDEDSEFAKAMKKLDNANALLEEEKNKLLKIKTGDPDKADENYMDWVNNRKDYFDQLDEIKLTYTEKRIQSIADDYQSTLNIGKEPETQEPIESPEYLNEKITIEENSEKITEETTQLNVTIKETGQGLDKSTLETESVETLETQEKIDIQETPEISQEPTEPKKEDSEKEKSRTKPQKLTPEEVDDKVEEFIKLTKDGKVTKKEAAESLGLTKYNTDKIITIARKSKRVIKEQEGRKFIYSAVEGNGSIEYEESSTTQQNIDDLAKESTIGQTGPEETIESTETPEYIKEVVEEEKKYAIRPPLYQNGIDFGNNKVSLSDLITPEILEEVMKYTTDYPRDMVELQQVSPTFRKFIEQNPTLSWFNRFIDERTWLLLGNKLAKK